MLQIIVGFTGKEGGHTCQACNHGREARYSDARALDLHMCLVHFVAVRV